MCQLGWWGQFFRIQAKRPHLPGISVKAGTESKAFSGDEDGAHPVATEQRSTARKVAARRRAGHWSAQPKPMMTTGKIGYKVGANIDATSYGGIAAMHRMAVMLGLAEAINERLELFKGHLSYHESDHVLNPAPNWLNTWLGSFEEDLGVRQLVAEAHG